jgi:hypothetical protein
MSSLSVNIDTGNGNGFSLFIVLAFSSVLHVV